MAWKQANGPAPAPDAHQPPVPEALPPPRVQIPLSEPDLSDNFTLDAKNGRVTLLVREAPLNAVLNALARQQGLNLVAGDDVSSNISVTLTDVPFDEAISSIVSIAGCTWVRQGDIILVTKIGSAGSALPGVQGRQVRIFPLSFVNATDIEGVVKGLLSPVGQIFVTTNSPTDSRRTQEMVVVEDLPGSMGRVADYIAQVDQPPRQVMIEAHVLQIDLKDDTKHGIDFKYMVQLAGAATAVGTQGFTNIADSPASLFTVNGSHLTSVLEAIKTTTDSKTLASPRIIVANGQEARIQIGSKFGYFVTTTTQTSTLQNVNFLNTGVVLRVTPQISADNQVLMHVRPEVSTGQINPNGLPQTDTTEAETTVLLPDGSGMVLGGLIKESNLEVQNKIPILGDIWLIGRLFQKRGLTRERSEIVIALIPRIVPFGDDYQRFDRATFTRAATPVLDKNLEQVPRPMEGSLPDAIENPRRLRFGRLSGLFTRPARENPKQLRFFTPTAPEEFPELRPPPDGRLLDANDSNGVSILPPAIPIIPIQTD